MEKLKITEKDFLNVENDTLKAFIFLGILVFTSFAVSGNFFLEHNSSAGQLLLTVILWVFFLAPFVVLGVGLILFFYNLFKYIKSKSYVSTLLIFKTMTMRMVYKWFSVVFITAFSISSYSYFAIGQKCNTFTLWNDNSYVCTFLEYTLRTLAISSYEEIASALYLFILVTFASVFVIMYIIGYLVDRHIAKKLLETSVQNS